MLKYNIPLPSVELVFGPVSINAVAAGIIAPVFSPILKTVFVGVTDPVEFKVSCGIVLNSKVPIFGITAVAGKLKGVVPAAKKHTILFICKTYPVCGAAIN
jgi:hypothetical protein